MDDMDNISQLALELLAYEDTILKDSLESLIIHNKTLPRHDQSALIKNVPDNLEPMFMEKFYAINYAI